MRSLAVLIGFVLAVTAGYWLWNALGAGGPAAALESESVLADAAPDAGDLAAPVVSHEVEAPEAAPVSTAEADEPDTRTALSVEARLTVRVFDRRTDAVAVGRGVYLDHGSSREQELVAPGSAGSQLGVVGRGVLTDELGEAHFRVPVGRHLRAFTTADDLPPPMGESIEAPYEMKIEIDPLDAGEERVVAISIGPEMREWHLRVVERESGRPIAGARVQDGSALDELEAEERASEVEGPPVLTDDDGRAVVRVQEYGHGATTIHASGYGPAQVSNANRREGEDAPFVVELDRGAVIRGRVVGLAIPEQASAQIRVRASKLVRPRDDFFYSGGDETWTAALDVGGEFELVDLPPEVGLELEFATGEAERQVVRAEVLRLQPGELHEGVWDLRRLGGVRGRVVDPLGVPIAELPVRLISGHATAQFGLHVKPLAEAISDAQGRFEFGELTAGDYLVGIGDQDQEAEERRAVAQAASVRVEQGADPSGVELVVHRGVYLRGHVYGPSGQPVENVHVFGVRVGMTQLTTTTDYEGAFTLGPLLAEEYRVSCFLLISKKGVSSPPSFTAAAPQDALEIHLLRGGSLAGHIVDPETGEGVLGRTSVQQPYGARKIATSVSGGDSSFHHEALSPGPHHLVAHTNDGRIGVLRGVIVEVGEDTRGLEIPVGAAGELRCKYEGPHERVHLRVLIDDVELASKSARPGEILDCRAPVGTVVVEATSGDWSTPAAEREVYARRVIEVIEGEELEVVVE